MCLACGEFVSAVNEDGLWRPLQNSCPDCNGQKFKHNSSGTVVRTDTAEE